MTEAIATRAQAVVTGASSGIGAAVAVRLLQSGYDVFGVARRGFSPDQSSVDRGRERAIGSVMAGSPHSVEVDLANLAALPNSIEELSRRLDRLEVVVLAAGEGRFGSLEQQSYGDISALIDLNLTANLMICRALVPLMKRRQSGKVIFIGSEAGLRGKRQGSVYCASKFGLRGFAQALRDECSGSGLAVSIVEPGMVRTPFFESLDFEPGPEQDHAMQAEQIADAVDYIVASPASMVVDEIELSPLKHVVRKKPRG